MDFSIPTTPETTYLDYMNGKIQARKKQAVNASAESTHQPDYPQQPQLWSAAEKYGESLRDTLLTLAYDLHDHPEPAFEEFHARDTLQQLLQKSGFEVQTPAYGLETALQATFSTANYDPDKHPTIAILAEYDALPELGHACGHNIIAAAGLGAFLTAVHITSASDLPQGKIVFLGTPAEEGHSGKEYLIRAGAFAEFDAAIMIHPFGFDVSEMPWVGRRTMTATFHGISAHASAQPYMGRNALDAASLAYQGMALLRQQMPPSDRIHATMTEGGDRPNVIPDSATLSIYVRSLLPRALVEISRRVDDVLSGAALMTGVGVTKNWDIHPASLPVRNNHALAMRWADTQKLRGRISLPDGVIPDSLAASTDFGNVSQMIPGLHPMVKISPENVALHTKLFAEFARTEGAIDGAVDSAIGLAQTAVDLLADPQLLAEAQAEFAATGGVVRIDDYLAGE